MGLTTERKIFLGLLGIAGASILIDQAILGPGTVGAATLTAEQVDEMPSQILAASVLEPVSRSVSQLLNERLGAMVSQNDVDTQVEGVVRMFSPVIEEASEVPLSTAMLGRSASLNQTKSRDQVRAEIPVLSAAMPARSGQSGAILDGFLYRVGELTTSGYRLLRVEPRKVLVEIGGDQLWISLPALGD